MPPPRACRIGSTYFDENDESGLAKEFVTVRANLPRAMPAEELAVRITALGGKAQAAPSIPDGVALAQSLAGDHGPVCALGTLYFSADVRQALAEQSH